MLTPTKTELEEFEYFSRDFDDSKMEHTEEVFSYEVPNTDYQICFYPDHYEWVDEYWDDRRWTIFDWSDDIIVIYPQSVEDIQTLIRLLSPNN